MQNPIDIIYEQLIDLIRHLPANQLVRIKSELENIVAVDEAKSSKTDLQLLLSNGSLMFDNQYATFKYNRKSLNQRRKK